MGWWDTYKAEHTTEEILAAVESGALGFETDEQGGLQGRSARTVYDEQGVPSTVYVDDEGIPLGAPQTADMDILREYSPTYQNQPISVYNPAGAEDTNAEFQAWKLRMGYGNLADDATPQGNLTLRQLWDSSLRIGRDNPFVQASDVSGTGQASVTDGSVATTDGDDVRAKMQTAFYAALRQAGMDKTTIDDLWAWAETEWTNDPSFTAERALIGMYDQQAFKDRFKGIDLMTQGGVGRRDLPTPGEYIRFEKYVASELSRVGVVETDFDTLIANLYVNSVGDAEVTERLNVAQKVMWDMPPEVRDKLTDWFGTEYGTSITMKTFLDNTGDWSKIQDDISTARTGGWGQMVAGLDAGWDKDLAKKVSDLGLSQAEQWSRFAELKEKEMLFAENIDEAVDLDYATEGVEAAFDLDDNDLSETIERRATGRSAKFSGGGGALLSGTTTGFGAANA